MTGKFLVWHETLFWRGVPQEWSQSSVNTGQVLPADPCPGLDGLGPYPSVRELVTGHGSSHIVSLGRVHRLQLVSFEGGSFVKPSY